MMLTVDTLVKYVLHPQGISWLSSLINDLAFDKHFPQPGL